MNLYKIGLPDIEQFLLKECTIADESCILITSRGLSVKWNEQNKYFRSSIWRKSDGELISAGFRKFVNYGEAPEFEPLPSNTNIEAIRKLDGSLMIVSKCSDKLIIRTRGTIDATYLDNGNEVDFLKKKYPKAFDNEWLKSGQFSLLFEWTTPTNRIVLQESEEPTLWLIGMVRHSDYSYIKQFHLDKYAKDMEVERPETLRISISDDVDKIKKQIETLKDIEGVVIYDESGQILKKIKTLRYLELHRVFTGIKSVNNIFDLFIQYGCPDRYNFEKHLGNEFDWELVTSLQSLISDFYSKWCHINNLKNVVESFLNLPHIKSLSRKEQASKILKAFPNDSNIAFSLLDKKEITPRTLWKTYTDLH